MLLCLNVLNVLRKSMSLLIDVLYPKKSIGSTSAHPAERILPLKTEKLNLRLKRTLKTPDVTIGDLEIAGKFECYILEDPVRDHKIPGKTAIPEGTYKVEISWSPRFKRKLPLLLDVPGFEGIRIHPGNTVDDTEGCLLPGRKKDASHVYESRLAFDTLFVKLEAASNIEIEIV